MAATRRGDGGWKVSGDTWHYRRQREFGMVRYRHPSWQWWAEIGGTHMGGTEDTRAKAMARVVEALRTLRLFPQAQ